MMLINLDKIPNAVARTAIEALQTANIKKWESLFAPGAKLFDDGNPRDLKKFTKDALGHERFKSIDKVEDDGLSITGQFHSDTWGDFVTYFKFTLNDQEKIVRLDIGQA
ncbi:MAG TPA: hypothetical protein VFE50_12645 [Cyclobacteriaceae bacterium]|nr:hypothetical protein [Cyclobacteriaceae bacterium]